MARFLITLLLLASGLPAAAEPEVRSGVPDGSPPAVGVETLAWLAGGTWTCEAFGGVAQETWLHPAGGQMAGVFRLVKDDGPSFYEMMILLVLADRLTLRLKHFDAALHGWETKDEVVDFPLVGKARDEAGRDTWFFDGLTIVREGPDAMAIHLRISSAGRQSVVSFPYRRGGTP